MVGNHQTLRQPGTDDLSRYGGVFHPSLPTHQATTIFSPAASVTASTGFMPRLAPTSKGDHIISSNGGSTFTPEAPRPGDVGSNSGTTKKRQSSLLEDKRKRKCWEVESQGSNPKVAIATPTVKATAKITVPVALTSPTSRRNVSPVVGAEMDPASISGTLPAKSSTYPTVTNKKDIPSAGPGTTSSLRAIRPSKTMESGSNNLPMTSTTTSGIPVGIAVARQRSTSSHVAVTNTATTSFADLSSLTSHSITGNNGMSNHSLTSNNGLMATASLASHSGLTATHSLATGNAGFSTATHSMASNLQATATGLHSVAGMGPGQCLPAMTLLTCDDGNANASAWASPWSFPVPMESQISQLQQPSNLQLIRDPNTGQLILLPTASYDPIPRTVVWPSGPGQGGAQLILPHPPHPQPAPLILDNRLVTLAAPTPEPLSPSGGDKATQSQPTALVKLEDNQMTGVMMPSTDYSKALGTDTNGYAILHQQPSFINPNFSAISSSTGSFLIQHISRNTPTAPMQMSPAPTLFNNGTRTNNLLISTPLPSGQQLTLAPPSADIKDNIATICYDNLYHNTTTTTMFNLGQTTSVLNQQTTSTQQMSTTSILVDKMSGNAFSVDAQDNFKIDMNSGESVVFANGQVENGDNGESCSNEETKTSENGSEDSQTSMGTQEEEEEPARSDAGNQTDMPDDKSEDSQDVHILDRPLSLNHGENGDKEVKKSREDKDIEEVKDSSVSMKEFKEPLNEDCGNIMKDSDAYQVVRNEANQILFDIDTRHVSDRIVASNDTSGHVSDKRKANVSISNAYKVTKIPQSNSSFDTLNKKETISPNSKRKMKQMPSLYPINQFLPKPDKAGDTRLVGFRSMPLLEDATKPSTLKVQNTDDVQDLVVNALMGLGNIRNGIRDPADQQNKNCDKQRSNTLASDVDKTNAKRSQVKSTYRGFSVSNLLGEESSSLSMEDKPEKEAERKSLDNVTSETNTGQDCPPICDSKARDEIVEVANILFSALRESKKKCVDFQNAFDTAGVNSCRRDSDGSAESGVDLSGLELLSQSIEQLENRRFSLSSEQKEMDYLKEASWDCDSHPNDSGISCGLDLLCALARERILQEGCSPASPVPFPRRFSKTSSKRWLSSDTEDEMFILPSKPRLYKRPPGVPYKEVSHTYRSLQSEQETRRVLASKQTYHYVPPTSIDLKEMETRKLLAEIQREFREAQRELSRLTPKKSPHSPAAGDSGSQSWKTGSLSEPGSQGAVCIKRKPGRPRKTDKDVESLKASGKKVRDMIKDRSSSPSPAKASKERIEARVKLSVRMPTPSQPNSAQAKSADFSPPVLTPFSSTTSPLTSLESTRPLASTFYRGRLTHDDMDSEDSDGPEPPLLSPESQCAGRKRGRPPKKQVTPEPPLKKLTKPTFVSIVLANKNKQAREKSLYDDDNNEYRPNKMRPKLKAEAKVKTSPPLLSSESDVSDLEDGPPPSITVRKPSLAAGGTHVKIRSQEVPEKKINKSLESPEKKSIKNQELPEKKNNKTQESSEKRIRSQEPPEKKMHKEPPSKEVVEMGEKLMSGGSTLAAKLTKNAPTHDRSVAKKHKDIDGDHPVLTEANKPVLPSVKRAKRAESGSSVGSTISCNTVPCDTEQAECKVTVEYLSQHEEGGTRVLVLNEGLLYAGQLTAISPPDIYGIQLDGERAHRPNIYSQEEILRDVILEVKLAPSSVKPGKRMCAYWSQQYRCLYPGVVVSEMSTARPGSPTFVTMEFDDGDSGSINVQDMRMLPQDFPVMTYENPLLTLGVGTHKRKRRNSSTSVDEVKETKIMKLDETIVEENEDELINVDAMDVNGDIDGKEKKMDVAPVAGEVTSSDSSGKRSKPHKMKKRKRSREEKREHKKHKKHKHKHRHKEKRHRSTSSEHSEKSDKYERSNRIEKCDNHENSERLEKLEKLDRLEKSEKSVKLDELEILERCGKSQIVNEKYSNNVKGSSADNFVENTKEMEVSLKEQISNKKLNTEKSIAKANLDTSLEAPIKPVTKIAPKSDELKLTVRKDVEKHNVVEGSKDGEYVSKLVDKIDFGKAGGAFLSSLKEKVEVLKEKEEGKVKTLEAHKELQNSKSELTVMNNTRLLLAVNVSQACSKIEREEIKASGKLQNVICEENKGVKTPRKEKKTKQLSEQEKKKSLESKTKKKQNRDSDLKVHTEKNITKLDKHDEDLQKSESKAEEAKTLTNHAFVKTNETNFNMSPNSNDTILYSKTIVDHVQPTFDSPTSKSSESASDMKLNSKVSKANSKESKPKNASPKSKASRQSSTDSKSSMTLVLPEKQLWDWVGESYKKCTTKKKGRKLFYKSIERGEETLSVGDCAVFLSTETDQPYIGKIDGFWESHSNMNVKVKWFYHPEETVGCPLTLPCYQGALFEASHFDENDIQTISHKCQVLSLGDYRRVLAETKDSTDVYYLAGEYDHINRKIAFEPGVDPTGSEEK